MILIIIEWNKNRNDYLVDLKRRKDCNYNSPGYNNCI